MKYTLLELVQLVASSIDSDEVNSIGDSTESLQIANIIRTVFFSIIGRAKLPSHYSLVNLQASNDTSKPVLMYLPSNIQQIEWVKYNNRVVESDPPTFTDIRFLDTKTFLDEMYYMNENDTAVGTFEHTVGPNTFLIQYMTDRPPTVYTTFDDNTIIFDAYNSDLEDTLQSSNTVCFGRNIIPFTLSDTFIPDLEEGQFDLLINEAKALAWAEMKQTSHAIAERNSRRGWATVQKQKHSLPHASDFDKLPNYGRK